MGKFCQFDRVICPQYDNGGVLSFYFFYWFKKDILLLELCPILHVILYLKEDHSHAEVSPVLCDRGVKKYFKMLSAKNILPRMKCVYACEI